MESRYRDQSDRCMALHEGRDYSDAEAGHGRDRQYVVDHGAHRGDSGAGLHGGKTRGGGTDESRRTRIWTAGNQDQCRVSRSDLHTFAHRCIQEASRDGREVCTLRADEAARSTRGSWRGGGMAVLRPRILRHRVADADRWWVHGAIIWLSGCAAMLEILTCAASYKIDYQYCKLANTRSRRQSRDNNRETHYAV